jgi:hypothetical protein
MVPRLDRHFNSPKVVSFFEIIESFPDLGDKKLAVVSCFVSPRCSVFY